jgi:hypothetical protein
MVLYLYFALFLSIFTNNKNFTCRAIFCITTGRSGSGYLHKILNMGENVKSYHEPYPTPILDILKDGHIYAETNHAFIKTFYDIVTDQLMDMNCRLDIIILRRYIPDFIL